MIQETYIVKHLTSQNYYQQTLHFHDIYELLFSLNDKGSFFLDNRVYDIRHGSVILIPEGVLHRKVNPSDVAIDTYTLHYPRSLLEVYSTPCTDLTSVYASEPVCLQLPEGMIEKVVSMFERCLSGPDASYGSDLRKNLFFLELLLELSPVLSKRQDNIEIRPNSSLLIHQVMQYINQNLSERLTLDQLSNQFFVSKYNLCHQFKRETGFTIIEYINTNRIRLACRLLRKEGAVSNIGARVGFPNASHFIHTFRKYVGTAPRDYIAQYRSHTNVPLLNSFSPTAKL